MDIRYPGCSSQRGWLLVDLNDRNRRLLTGDFITRKPIITSFWQTQEARVMATLIPHNASD